MDKIKIGIAIVFAALSFFFGVYYAADQTSQSSQTTNFELPEYNTSVTSSDDVPIRTLRDFNNAIVSIAERTNPTVVTITTTQTVRVRQQSPFGLFFDDPRFNREREFQRSGLGSGVIVSADGYIITNNHVIDNADEIRVILFDGDELDAEIVGTDPASDIAVLKVSSSSLSAVPMGNSDDIRVGEMVLAIGSPLDQQFAHTVSKGIVSASGRSTLGLNMYENYIQTDAAINPGNSGGALINLDGELIGINTAIASRSGGNQGIGFAIPVNMVRNVMEALITDGRVARGFLGINFGGEVDRTMARVLGLERARGFLVGDVVPEGPAADAGIREGDVILRLNGSEVRNWTDFRVEVGNMSPGTVVELEIFRDGERTTLPVTLGELDTGTMAGTYAPSQRDTEEIREALGFDVENLTDSVRRQLNLGDTVSGVVVTSINQTSRAYRQGLRQFDVISQVADVSISSSEQFFVTVGSLISSEADAALLRVNRQGRNVFIAIEL
ncbi:MAG: Do family serine endopeptidase [Balneolaceae bacterium]|nr:MAG: Do family serine endopeptidase [Balneolaceae bacterium]